MEIVLDNITFWHWLILGFTFILIELVIWSTYFLWIGVSAITIAILINLYPSFTPIDQMFGFLGFSAVTIFIAKKILPVKTIDEKMQKNAKKLIGKVAEVVALKDDLATIKIGNSIWKAEGCEMVVGQSVKVINTQSSTLIVKPNS